MFLINNHLGVYCIHCKFGSSLIDLMIRNNHSKLDEIYTCNCGRKQEYFEAIKNYYCSDSIFNVLSFISNIDIGSHEVELTVGVPFEIIFYNPVPIIHKIFITNYEKSFISFPYYWEHPTDLQSISKFDIMTIELNSENEKNAKYGDKVKVGWQLFGRTLDFDCEPWKQLLVQSREQFYHKKYLLSFLSVAMALESFINSNIQDHLSLKNIDDKSIGVFLKESSMIEKSFTLFKSMLNYDPKDYGLPRNVFNTIIEKRNKIAHGKVIPIDKNETQEIFSCVLKFILNIEYLNKKLKYDSIISFSIFLQKNNINLR